LVLKIELIFAHNDAQATMRNTPIIKTLFAKRRMLVFVVCCLASFTLSGQNRWGITASGSWGFLAPHHKPMQYLINGHTLSASLGLRLRFSDKTHWLQSWRYPDISLQYGFSSLGNREVLGYAHSLICNADIRIAGNAQHALFYTLGGGPAILTRPFDRETNYLNTAIGSHLNAHFRLGLGYSFTPRNSPRTSFRAGLQFNHYSNGSLFKPNLGLNLVTMGMGIVCFTGQSDSTQTDNPPVVIKHTGAWVPTLHVSVGLRQRAVYDPRHYPVLALNANFNYSVSSRRMLGPGIELNYDMLTESVLLDNLATASHSPFRMGIHLNQDLYFGNIILSLQAGVYLVNPKKSEGYIYDRIGFRYRFHKNLMAGLMLKSHLSVADCFELSFGYRW